MNRRTLATWIQTLGLGAVVIAVVYTFGVFDVITLLIAQSILKKHKGTILYDLRSAGAQAYLSLMREVIKHGKESTRPRA